MSAIARTVTIVLEIEEKRFCVIQPRTPEEATGGGCETLYVHSGLSSLGWVLGGPHEALKALGSVCDNLFLPTHTYSYPPAPGVPAPVFDWRATPSEMGLLAETFWRTPGVTRSIHSSHSLAGQGPRTQEILAGHYENDTPCGEGTPYSRLVHGGACALMLGVSFRYYTPFHTAEWESGSDWAAEPLVFYYFALAVCPARSTRCVSWMRRAICASVYQSARTAPCRAFTRPAIFWSARASCAAKRWG